MSGSERSDLDFALLEGNSSGLDLDVDFVDESSHSRREHELLQERFARLGVQDGSAAQWRDLRMDEEGTLDNGTD